MAIAIAEINSKNIKHNLSLIRDITKDAYILAMVKANGYGHSILDVSRILRELNVEYLGVAFIGEAIKIRQAGDKGKILVTVSPEPSDADLFIDYNIEIAFSSFEILNAFSQKALEREVIIRGHLYVDSGMHRDGMSTENALIFMDYVKDNPYIKIVGLMTHLATADIPEIDFAEKQLERFESVKKILESRGNRFKYIHTANSSAIINYPHSHYNMVRPGIALYGYLPNEQLSKKLNLKPVME